MIATSLSRIASKDKIPNKVILDSWTSIKGIFPIDCLLFVGPQAIGCLRLLFHYVFFPAYKWANDATDFPTTRPAFEVESTATR